MAASNIPVSVAYGDGIGPEIMEATLEILKYAKAPLDFYTVEIGEKVYLKGHLTGIEPKTWETIRKTKAFLKAPMTTPQGGGFKSLNVTIRAALGLYANVRPSISYYPFIETKHPKMDVVIIRENEEDLYMGIEYQVTENTYHALKVITRPGCEKIIHYAFQYARANGRKKVTCFTKDNILKMSDGLFHKIFDEIAPLYPEIENEHWIVDIGSAKLADTPENFDVIVLPNLYGDILSDVAAQIAGSVGLAGSANVGQFGAMFEAIHGSAPRRAGQNIANPSGLILASVMMLVHLELPEIASLIHNAWLTTIEDGIHTYDIFKTGVSKEKVGTKEFAKAIISRLGQKPKTLKEMHYKKTAKLSHHALEKKKQSKHKLIGADIFIEYHNSVDELQKIITTFNNGKLELEFIANRGAKVWPNTTDETSLGDSWRCRFTAKEAVETGDILTLLNQFNNAKLTITDTSFIRHF
ncbi:MAG TPA: NADP-dependent isocitrate dehydrogenase [Parachlamydiaceae bacterium]|nr:NADP-dependent isocitrate dehydrogenase [Parachlamydiaceae bacterium]